MDSIHKSRGNNKYRVLIEAIQVFKAAYIKSIDVNYEERLLQLDFFKDNACEEVSNKTWVIDDWELAAR